MKTIGLTLLILLNCTANQSALDEKYKQAFRYIQTSEVTRNFCREIAEIADSFVCKKMSDTLGDSLVCIAVSDSIVSVANLFFFDDIIKYEYKDRTSNIRSLRDSLYMAELQSNFSPFFLPSFHDLPSCKDARLILFFSKPCENRLTAELLPYYGGSSKSFSSMTEYTRALQFLFYFSPQDSIEKVFTVQFQYD